MEQKNKITEQESLYFDLEKKSVAELLQDMNAEDQKVATAVKECIPMISSFVEVLSAKMKNGGRLFYIGAGTSGRLGILDASECPPTFGVPHDMVIGLIAGGDSAIRKAVEFAEDSTTQAWIDLNEYQIDDNDVVLGIAASGTTPYVIHGLARCKENNILTACISCNPESPIIQQANYPIVCVVGPEFITGSTRLKSGTAQKMILNMISTSTMIQLGRAQGNKMVDMQLTNNKLKERAIRMIMEHTHLTQQEAEEQLKKHTSVREVLQHLKSN